LLIITSKENKNYYQYRLLIFFIGLLIIIISELTLRFIDRSFLNNLIILIIPFILISILYLTMYFKFNFKESK
jgi:hypothetical protein